MNGSVILMGVAGAGKTTLGAAVAARTGSTLIEGDDFHSPANRQKMRSGQPLTDGDRAEWLDALAAQLTAHPAGVLMTCSALKRRYRDRLRAAAPDLRFVFLDVAPETARQRVGARQSQHPFPPSLVASQFDTLEAPDDGEADVLRVAASVPIAELTEAVLRWGWPTENGAQNDRRRFP